MRVICPFCSAKALITSTNAMNDEKTVTDLYCSCTNIQSCGATFVYTLAYNHVINPPARTTKEIAIFLVNQLNQEDRATLQRSITRTY